MKPSYFDAMEEDSGSDEDGEDGEEGSEDSDGDTMMAHMKDDDDDDEDDRVTKVGRKRKAPAAAAAEDSSSSSSSSSSDDEESDEEDDTQAKRRKLMHAKGGAGFDSGSEESSSDDDDDSDDEGSSAPSSKSSSSRKKRTNKKKEEEEITRREHALMEGTAMPKTANDFERLVIATPNNSFLWISYMTNQIQLMEFDVARSVAERALKTIHFREEDERLNVWVAYLNLEQTYGDDVAFAALHKRAMQNNDKLKLALRLVDAMQKSKVYFKCDTLYGKMLKKYGSKTTAVWIRYGKYLHETRDVAVKKGGSATTPREVLKDALKRLNKSEHIDLIVKFAQMEFSYGGAEYGRTMYEGVIANYPKRLDVWKVYVDQEMKLNEGEGRRARQLLDRLVTLKLSSKKMQFVFKKYLKYEQKHGNAKKQERVKQMAREWVERKESTEE